MSAPVKLAQYHPARGKVHAFISNGGDFVCIFKTAPPETVGHLFAAALQDGKVPSHSKWSRENDSACEAIKYVLANQCESPMEFLRCWTYGDFDAIRQEWENVPDSVFIGADQFHPLTKETELFTCAGKGGEYELIGESAGAGHSRGETIRVYRDTSTGHLFHRMPEDFENRMEKLP